MKKGEIRAVIIEFSDEKCYKIRRFNKNGKSKFSRSQVEPDWKRIKDLCGPL